MIRSERTKFWKSTELYEQYVTFDGVALLRRRLMLKLAENLMDGCLIILPSGCASRMILNSVTLPLLGINETITTYESDDIENDKASKKVASSIMFEIKEMKKR